MNDYDDTSDPNDLIINPVDTSFDISSDDQHLDNHYGLPAGLDFNAPSISENYSAPSSELEEPAFVPEPTGGDMATGSPSEHSEQDTTETEKHEGLRFRGGVCSHCGGRGYTTYPSSGSQVACWYCSGSGVAH